MAQCGLGDPTPTKGPAFVHNPRFSEDDEMFTEPNNLRYPNTVTFNLQSTNPQ